MSDLESPKLIDAGTSAPIELPAPSSSSPKITVSGVTFDASQVVSAVVKIDGRKIHICEEESEPAKVGFKL